MSITPDMNRIFEKWFILAAGEQILIQVYRKFYYRVLSTEQMTVILFEKEGYTTLYLVDSPIYAGLAKVQQSKESCIGRDFRKRLKTDAVLVNASENKMD